MNSYTANLKINPKKHFISADISLDYYFKDNDINEITFYIYKDIKVENITSPDIKKYEVSTIVSDWSPFILESKSIKITLKRPFNCNEKINLKFQYSGNIEILNSSNVNRISEEWTELGLYSPWFPLTQNMEPALFNVIIDISNNYTVVGASLSDHFILNKKIPENDCTIIAAPNLNCIHNSIDNISLDIYYTKQEGVNTAKDISTFSSSILKYYIDKFGDIPQKSFSIVLAPRNVGGGYCRKDLIVLSPMGSNEIYDKAKQFRFLAHELAHLWWCKANCSSYEDWLNESFAEYSSLIALNDLFDKNEAQNILTLYKTKSKTLPKIEGIARNYENAYEVLYYKGSVILNELENKIGKASFYTLLKELHKNNICSTRDFLQVLENISDTETANFFHNALQK
ncbi:M1 family aminopeptidase [Clostridium hydrogenum]|uniref:M1 family aminopeptidase n=1 Tax=Clostridium hydrogenum TaxID=2855764 RepID=UPI001F464BA5|nr:M1 family aminopeptidase [Clostridium hydrogenum]